MSIQTQEARIILAIEAIRTSKKLSRRKAAKIYKVPESTLRDRINGRTTLPERRPVVQNLTELEEQIIVNYILDRDSRGFSPRQANMEDIALFTKMSESETSWKALGVSLYTTPPRVKDAF
jgi:hypothetical protein